MTDIEQFADWYDLMEYEGGLVGIIRHGHDGTGDNELDTILKNLEAWLDKADARINQILEDNHDALS